jgi:hypothetical protein
MKQQIFGRRTQQQAFSQTITKPPMSRGESFTERGAQVERPGVGSAVAKTHSIEDELLEWKRARRHSYCLPWRQISLMASASFGIAYFVLPDSVNQIAQWPLLALVILSFASSFSRRPPQKN